MTPSEPQAFNGALPVPAAGQKLCRCLHVISPEDCAGVLGGGDRNDWLIACANCIAMVELGQIVGDARARLAKDALASVDAGAHTVTTASGNTLGYDALLIALGANPIEYITRSTGWWTLSFLLVTLLVTPLRRLTGLNWLLRLRRMLGLFAFSYGLAHLFSYLWLDQFFDWHAIVKDIAKRPFITVGFLAWLLLVPVVLMSAAFTIWLGLISVGGQLQVVDDLLLVRCGLGLGGGLRLGLRGAQLAEHLGDPEAAVAHFNPHADLREVSRQDVRPVAARAHERFVDAAGRRAAPDVLADRAPAAHLRRDAGVVVDAPAGGHLRAVAMRHRHQIGRDGEPVEAAFCSLCINEGH